MANAELHLLIFACMLYTFNALSTLCVICAQCW